MYALRDYGARPHLKQCACFMGWKEEPTHYVIDAVYELFTFFFFIDKSVGGVLDKLC